MEENVKPEPISVEKIKEANMRLSNLDVSKTNPLFLPHNIEIELTNGKIINFVVQNGEEAARFADSYHAIVEQEKKVLRVNIGPIMHVIPTERIVDVRIVRSIPRVGENFES